MVLLAVVGLTVVTWVGALVRWLWMTPQEHAKIKAAATAVTT
jgi:hypothetical protein